MKLKIRQVGLNLLISENGVSRTVVIPSDYNTDKLFALAYKINERYSPLAEHMYKKEIAALTEKKVVIDEDVQNARYEKKKLKKEIKKLSSLDINKLPINVPEEWREVLESKEDPTGIENMLLWLSMNDNERTRQRFLSNFSSKYPYITKNGYLVSIRAVWKEKEGESLYNFIQSSYVKIRGFKKAPKNYTIIQDAEGGYSLERDVKPEHIRVGNLQNLYNDFEARDKTVYISNYSKNTLNRSDNWTLGSVAEIHDKATHSQICGINQLHILSNPHDAISGVNGNYGDTFLIVLTNPKDIINAEYGWKFTTSRFYIAAEISREEISEYFQEHWGDFDYDYMEHDMSEIKQVVEVENAKVAKQKHKLRIDQLRGQLKKVKSQKILNNTTEHLSPELYSEILSSRISLLNK